MHSIHPSIRIIPSQLQNFDSDSIHIIHLSPPLSPSPFHIFLFPHFSKKMCGYKHQQSKACFSPLIISYHIWFRLHPHQNAYHLLVVKDNRCTSTSHKHTIKPPPPISPNFPYRNVMTAPQSITAQYATSYPPPQPPPSSPPPPASL